MPVKTEGRVLAGRYKVLGRLGTGGMATVYLCEDQRLGRQVAVKRLHAESPEDTARRFQREAKLGASLNHHNVVSIFDTVTDDEGVLIVMEYVEGPTLSGLLQAEERIEPERALRILHGVAAALDHAHEHGVVHRDVKPANVLIGEGDDAKLVDLGIAAALEGTRITRSGTVLGTASYMAPEQVDGATPGPPADIYTLAAVAYEMLSGRKAREGRTPVEIAQRVVAEPPPRLDEAWPGAPREAVDVLCRAMSRDPSERPPTAGAFVSELARAFEQASGSTGSNGEGTAATAFLPPASGSRFQRTEHAGAAGTRPQPEHTPSREDLTPSSRPDSTPSRPDHTPARAQRTIRGRNGAPAPAVARSEHSARRAPSARPARRGRRELSWLIPAALAALIAVVVAVFGLMGSDDDGGDTPRDEAPAAQRSEERGGDSRGGGREQQPEAGATAPAPSDEAPPASGTSGGDGSYEVPQPSGNDPARGARLNDQGYSLMRSDPAAAVPILEDAVRSFPSGTTDIQYAYALFNLGSALRRAGRPDDAIPVLEERLKIDNQRDVVQAELDRARSEAGS